MTSPLHHTNSCGSLLTWATGWPRPPEQPEVVEVEHQHKMENEVEHQEQHDQTSDGSSNGRANCRATPIRFESRGTGMKSVVQE